MIKRFINAVNTDPLHYVVIGALVSSIVGFVAYSVFAIYVASTAAPTVSLSLDKWTCTETKIYTPTQSVTCTQWTRK